MSSQLSTTAMQLHLCAALESARTGRTGFVADDFLATIEEDITPAVTELCGSAVWVRDGDGYRIPPDELRRVIEVLRELDQDRATLR